ncbi:MAG TPA: lysine 2,3-aminomutase, partial [Desulfobacteraceae bacterium]|nr:lysine 2,3-aminomutase [Desulfobacteraceae bacterium]
PYTPDYFKAFAPLANELTNIRVNDEGTIDIQYMAKIGNEDYLIGHRPERQSARNPSASDQEIKRLQTSLAQVPQTGASIVKTGLDNLDRLHMTRVRLGFDAKGQELDYIRGDHRITDVVLAGDGDVKESLHDVCRLVTALKDISHVTAVRIQSAAFVQSPADYSRAVINTLGDLNALSVVGPQRLEIETWALQAGDISDDHAVLTRRLNNRGITVYVNVPLLGGVNDSADAIHDMAHALRTAGMEFHHLYVAGTPLQSVWNHDFPVDSWDVTDIATKVRREGSGREIPRYIIATPLGEVDYGLTSTFIREGDRLKLRLSCYDKSYFDSIDEKAGLADEVSFDESGCPVTVVRGLIKTNDFPVS